MKQYKVVENSPNSLHTEARLNGFAGEGWKVVGFTQYQILLERNAPIGLDEGQEGFSF